MNNPSNYVNFVIKTGNITSSQDKQVNDKRKYQRTNNLYILFNTSTKSWSEFYIFKFPCVTDDLPKKQSDRKANFKLDAAVQRALAMPDI